MVPQTIGEDLLRRDEQGRLAARIATVFPRTGTVVTLPGIHATQRIAYTQAVNAERAASALPPLTPEEEEDIWLNGAVDLVLEDQTILIRPDPDNMALAFDADELLQERVSKKRIKFLHVLDDHVRNAIMQRGERWRIAPLPRSPEEMQQMIANSRIGIGGREIYYYNRATGTRLLTCQALADVCGFPDAEELRRYLIEVRDYSFKSNSLGNPEVSFFMADGEGMRDAFAQQDFAAMDAFALRCAGELLRQSFADAVAPEFRSDDVRDPVWRSRMYAALIGHTDKEVSEEQLLGLSAEFFMQVEWLPGGRIENGELMLDPVFDEEDSPPAAPASGTPGNFAPEQRISDLKARGFIFNFIRDYGNLEHINIGRVSRMLSRRKPVGRHGVYLAEIKQQGDEQPLLRILRMQKYGVAEHLDEGKDLLGAILQAEQYTEYIMDRRLGCRQLGMHIPPRTVARKVGERYTGSNWRFYNTPIWSTYFERDYIAGLATDKIPACRLVYGAFAEALARVLGRAAAANLVVGRAELGGKVIFDDGDELVIEGPDGLPVDIVAADHTGTFVNYRDALCDSAAAYAESANKRLSAVPDPRAFADAFVAGFVERFTEIQQEYRKRRRAFDTLFKHLPRDEGGSFAFRWECVLKRLDAADAADVAARIRRNIRA